MSTEGAPEKLVPRRSGLSIAVSRDTYRHFPPEHDLRVSARGPELTFEQRLGRNKKYKSSRAYERSLIRGVFRECRIYLLHSSMGLRFISLVRLQYPLLFFESLT